VINLRETIVMHTTEKALRETGNPERQPDLAISLCSFDL
jgi:hypothetical protein